MTAMYSASGSVCSQRDVERAGLEALQVVDMEESEARPQRSRNAPPPAARSPDRACCCRAPRLRNCRNRAAPARRAWRSPSPAARCSRAHGSRRAAHGPGIAARISRRSTRHRLEASSMPSVRMTAAARKMRGIIASGQHDIARPDVIERAGVDEKEKPRRDSPPGRRS